MKYKYLLFLILFFVFLSNIQAITVKGKITDSQTELGINNAKVVAYSLDGTANDSVFVTFTNSEGDYLINIPPSAYSFYVTHPEYSFGEFGSFFIEEDQILNFELNPLSGNTGVNNVSGKVLDDFTLLPIFGAVVELRSEGQVLYSDTTAGNGHFLLEEVEAGEYIFSASAPGYEAFIDSFSMSDSGHIHFNVYLTAENGFDPGSLNGNVYYKDAAGNEIPITGAQISLDHMVLGLHFETTSNESGEYSFDEIPLGKYFVNAVADGFGYVFEPPLNIFPGVNTHNIKMFENNVSGFGTISGHVYFDGSNEPILGAVIHFIPTPGGPQFFAAPLAFTDSSGYYEYQLPSWDYYVMVEYYFDPVMLNPYIEFYDDVQNFAEATPVTVSDSISTENIDFGIPSPNFISATIEGKVEEENGNPLSNARVSILSGGNNSVGIIYSLEDFTNEDGEYSITIEHVTPFSNSFIVMAMKEGFKKEFYNNKPEMFLADRIIIDSPEDTTVTDIDFSLEEITPLEFYSISGTVADSLGMGLNSTIVAAFGTQLGSFGFAITDSVGDYFIPNLPEGIYYVLFYRMGYAPQFYDGAMVWEDADPIDLQANITGINAVLIEMPILVFPGNINGVITNDGEPVSGVMVSVSNSNQEMIAYSMTNASGQYNISGLNSGSYNLTATKVNYQSQTQNINFDLSNGTNQVINLNLPTGVTDVEDDVIDVPSDFTLGNNYPNPFNPSTTITYSLPEAANVKLTVFNAIGQEIANLIKGNVEAGNHSITFNAENLNSGIYFYKLETGKFVSVKKMILLK